MPEYIKVSKGNGNDSDSFRVVNEFIATSLAEQIGLPVPRFSVETRFRNDRNTGRSIGLPCFITIGVPLQSADNEACELIVTQLPQMAAGILLFDVWVANVDRHAQNILVNSRSAPTTVCSIDHDHALFGRICSRHVGLERLVTVRDQLGIERPTHDHVLIKHFTTDADFPAWYDRIRSVPSARICELCEQCREYGLTAEEAAAATDFLVHRQQNLPSIVANHRAAFVGM